jgi:hypothetical protein
LAGFGCQCGCKTITGRLIFVHQHNEFEATLASLSPKFEALLRSMAPVFDGRVDIFRGHGSVAGAQFIFSERCNASMGLLATDAFYALDVRLIVACAR